MVKAGDLLFELDPRPFQSEIDRAVEELNIAKAQGEAATKDEERTRQLYERKASTLSEVEKVEAVRKTWDAQIISAEESVKRQELEFSYSKIDAPISGKIGRALLTEGNLVNAGGSDPVLTTIVATDPIQIYFSVDERALLQYRERRRAEAGADLKPVEQSEIPFEFGLDTDIGYPNRGTIDFADNRIDPTTGTIEVRGKAPNPDGIFVAGGRVRVRVSISAPYKAVLIPDTAVLADQDKKYLLCVNKDNVVVRRDVQLGRLLDDGMRVVLPNVKSDESLTSDDWVIVLGLQRARINYPVEPVDADSNVVATTNP
jgi:RND family efflux transporter MFP subunit